MTSTNISELQRVVSSNYTAPVSGTSLTQVWTPATNAPLASELTSFANSYRSNQSSSWRAQQLAASLDNSSGTLLPGWYSCANGLCAKDTLTSEGKAYSTGAIRFTPGSDGTTQMVAQVAPASDLSLSTPFMTPTAAKILDSNAPFVLNQRTRYGSWIANVNNDAMFAMLRKNYKTVTTQNGETKPVYSGPTNRNVAFIDERTLYPKNYRSYVDFDRVVNLNQLTMRAQTTWNTGAIRT